MALNSDPQGFLVGEAIQLEGLRDEMGELRREVKALREAMQGRAPAVAGKPAKASAAPAVPVVVPRRRAGSDIAPVASSAPAAAVSRSRGVSGRFAQVAPAAEPQASTSGRDSDWERGSGRGIVGRASHAAAAAAGGVVTDEADPSVKAFNEVAEPLKRGWAALRGDGDTHRRSEGWLKRLFGESRGEGGTGVGSRKRAEGLLRRIADAITAALPGELFGGAAGARGRQVEAGAFDAASSHARSVAAHGVGPSPIPAGGGEMSLSAITAHLRSIDRKTVKPGGFSLIGAFLTVARFAKSWMEWRMAQRGDNNLDRIAAAAEQQLKVSTPFFAYARKRLREMGEADDGAPAGGGGMIAAMIAATLGAGLAKLAGLLSGVPLLGRGIAALARAAGGAVDVAADAADAAADAGAATVAPVSRARPRWGRGAGGIRGNRMARLARVAGRNAGRFMRPAGAMLKRVPVLGSLIAVGAGVVGAEAISRDKSLTREQRNGAHGRNVGGVGGALGGALGGAALGTLVAGPIGTVIGGVLGAVLGEWLGGNLGQMLGEKFDAVMAPVTAGFLEVKAWALATWGWVRDGAAGMFESVKTTFGGVGEWISGKWDEFVGGVKGVFDSFTGLISNALNALRNLPVIGPAIRAAETAASAAADAARAAADKAREAGTAAAGAVAGAAGAAADKAREVGAGAAQAAQGVASVALNAGRTIAKRKRWEGAREHLVDAASAAGVDPGIVAKIAGFESGFDSTAAPILKSGRRLSSAHGFGQFLDGTWTTMLNRHGAKYGVAGAGKLTDAQARRYRGNEKLQAQMLAEFTRENVARGRKLGGGDDDANVYALHNLGEGDGAKFLKAMKADPSKRVSDVLSAKVIANNPSLYAGGNITLAQAYGRMGSHMRAYEWAAEDARGSSMMAGAKPKNAVRAAPPLIAAQSAVGAASSAVPVAPRAPAPPVFSLRNVLPDAPAVQVPLGSGAGKSASAPPMRQDVGQDVRDRNIAHIATGGYARA